MINREKTLCPLRFPAWRNCAFASNALIERVNTRRWARREYLHDFSASTFSFSRLGPIYPLGLTVSRSPYRLPSLQTRISLRTVSRQTSLTDFTPLDFHDPVAPSPLPPVIFLSCPFAALVARLSNCHFLRQIVLSRVGVADTRIKLAPKKRRRGNERAGKESEGLRTEVETSPRWGGSFVSFTVVNITIRV